MRDAETVKLILKLIAIVGTIWGLGWLIYENTPIRNGITTTNYQNILLVLMSTIWLIILLATRDKEPKNRKPYIPPIIAPKPTRKRKQKSNTKPATSIVKKVLKKYLEQTDSS